MKWKERLNEVVARRQLTIEGSNKRVTIILGKPIQATKSGETCTIWDHVVPIPKGDWVCPFKITGLPDIEGISKPCYNEVWGKDSLDALLGAVQVIDSILRKLHPTLHWKYSDGLNDGLPMILSYYSLTNKLELEEKFLKEIGRYLKKPEYNKKSPYWREKMRSLFAWSKKHNEDQQGNK